MTNVEKFFKEWGSVCRMLTKKDKAIYSHKELLDFAEQYRQSKVSDVVLDDVIKCEKCGSIEMYQYTKTKDKCEDCGHIQSVL
tara:strand:- start:445 stop:693 length:249 start_codon:yes stop_codon:yes gene_type:complete